MKGGTLLGISPANRELAEEINIIPTFSLHSCSSGQGQEKLQVRATSGTSSAATLSSRPVPSLLLPISMQPRLPDPSSQPLEKQ